MEHSSSRVLSGDIGGTKTRLALIDVGPGPTVQVHQERTYPSADYATLDDIVRDFLERHPAPCERAGFGIAGPIREGRCETTNLPWVIDACQLERDFGFQRVTLLNDLEATARGLRALGDDDFLTLQPGNPDPTGNASIIAAGTGLGEAGMTRDGDQYRPFGSEGGHTGFCPGNALEIRLLEFLAKRYGRVSWERVVCGPGLVNIHQFLCADSATPAPSWLTAQMQSGDPAAAISKAALAHKDPLCDQALDLFVHLYGVEAGDHALKLMATGGVYIGGGIAPKILDRLKGPGFLDAFLAKGRMRPLMEQMPVKVVLNDRTALYGPALAVAGQLPPSFPNSEIVKEFENRPLKPRL